MKLVKLKDFHELLRAQGVPTAMDNVFICPMCKTPQSPRDFVNAGAGKTLEEVEPHVGYACVGRFLGAGPPRKAPDGKPCNWHLGGLLKTHTMVVILPAGRGQQPHHEPASPEVAQQHARAAGVMQ